MAKTRVSRKWVLENYPTVISVPYCALQHVLSQYEPRYYTAGIYGWNSDIYVIGNGEVAISTGYRPFGNKTYSYKQFEFWDNEVKSGKRTALSVLVFQMLLDVKMGGKIK